MAENKLKFDKVSDLIHEIDKWIDLLKDKRKEVLSKIDLETVKLAFPEDKGKYHTDNNGKEWKLIATDTDNRDKFSTYSVYVNKDNYETIANVCKKLNEKTSSLIRNYYYLNFINNKDFNKEYAQILLMANKYKDMLEVEQGKGKSIALALNVRDSEKLEQAAKKLQVYPRELIRYLTYQLILDEKINHKIKDKYKEEDADISYNRCKSTNVAAFGYRKASKTLYVIFRGGRKYRYDKVDEKVYLDFLSAASKGEFVNKCLVNKYPYKKIN